jgi:hypothetical protein
MDLTTLRSRSRKYTKTNATNYANTDLDEDINIANGEIHMMILEAEGFKNTGGDFKVIDHEDTTSLTAQELGYNGEYPFPAIALKLEEVYVKYTSAADYVRAEIVDKSELSSEMFEDTAIYDETNPKVFIYRDSFFIRPLLTSTTVTDGIKLLVLARQDTLTNASDTPTFESNFHNLIPLKVAQDYYLVYPEKYNPRIDKKVQELEQQLISFYMDRSPVVPRFQETSSDRGLTNW